MKKKNWLLISTIGLLIVASISILVIRYVIKPDVKASRGDDNIAPTRNVEKSIIDDGEEEIAKIEVDTDPNSITVLVNKEYSIDKDYKPADLVEPDIKFSFNYKDEKRKLRKEAAENLEQLFQAAKKLGYELLGVSGFRSYDRQKTIYEYNLIKNGFDYTAIYSAMPGTSEHQTGLSIDVSCPTMKGLLTDEFGETNEGKWLQENCYKYGYIIRYPKNKTDVTGYGYEPWHIRYVGTELARHLFDSNITLDEYYGYKMDINIVDRNAYGYYDYLLTQNSGGYGNISEAVLDDVVDKQNVNVDNSESVTKNNDDNKESVNTSKEPLRPDDELEDDKEVKTTPMEMPSMKPIESTQEVTPIPEPSKASEQKEQEKNPNSNSVFDIIWNNNNKK